MKEIKISNSKLKLQVYRIPDKKSIDLSGMKYFMVYQEGVIINRKTKSFYLINLNGITNTPVIDTTKWEEIMFLLKSDSKNGDVAHTENEYEYLLYYLRGTVDSRHKYFEAVLKSTRNRSLVNLYNSSYGCNLSTSIMNYNINFDEFDKYSLSDHEKYHNSYKRYSVVSFINDIKKYNIKFKLLTDFISYKRITVKEKDDSGNEVEYTNDYVDLMSIRRNKTRANLSLTYKIKVNVKDTNGNVHSDLDTIKSACIIKDGLLNTTYLALKVNNGRFIYKMKSLGMIYTNLSKNEFIVDLSKIPVISRADFCRTYESASKSSDYNLICKTFQLDYLDYVSGKQSSKSSTMLPNGIDDVKKEYFPVKTKTVSTGKSYYVNSIESNPIGGFPKSSSERLVVFKNKSKYPKDSILTKLMEEVDNLLLTKSYDEIKKNFEKSKKSAYDSLAEERFKLIMSKNCAFSDTKKVAYGRKYSTIGKYGILKTSWRFSNHKIDL